MCLGIAGRIVAFDAARPDVASVAVEGVARDINIGLLEGLEVGDWILIHLGFALETMTAEEAADSVDMLRTIGPNGDVETAGEPEPPATPERARAPWESEPAPWAKART